MEGTMPFVERNVMSEREEFVMFAAREESNISALCRRFGISRKTGYKWLERHRQAAEGMGWSADRSRRPRTCPGRTDSAMEAAVLEVRAAHPAWGGRKIRHVLVASGLQTVPSASTVTAILARHDKIAPEASRAATPYVRFEHEAPNRLWQMDFKGHFAISAGRCHPLTVLDDHSRYNICLAACANEQGQTVKAHLTEAFRRYGLPDQMIMDNGAPWGDATGSPWTPLTVWLLMLAIRVSHGRSYHPQTQGKDERFHRSFKAEVLSCQSFATLADCQQRFDAWRSIYNRLRPHQALDMAVPASRYLPSPRPFPDVCRPPDYDQGETVLTVRQKGELRYKGKTLHLPKAFSGYKIAIRNNSHDDNKIDICFGAQRIKTVDLNALER
jgi:transposase InsO family protein